MTKAEERSPLVTSIMGGLAPPQLLKAAAKGILPIPQEEQIEVLVFLRNHEDGEVRLAAKESLMDLDMGAIKPLLEVYEFDPDVFSFFGQVFKAKPDVLIALIRNPKCTTQGMIAMAHQAKDPKVLDVIITNQSKIMEDPDILNAVMENPVCTLDLARRVLDMVNQFMQTRTDLRMQARRLMAKFTGTAPEEMTPMQEAPPPPPPTAAPPAPAPEASTAAPEAPPAEAPLAEVDIDAPAEPGTTDDLDWREDAAEDFGIDDFGEFGDEPGIDDFAAIDGEETEEEDFEEEDIKTLQQQLVDMNVPEKVQLALKGNKEARTLLIKDPNKMVQSSVIDSPKITDSEIDFICKQRNVTDEVLRKISGNREWMKRYSVVSGLVFNPKTPVGISMKLVNRLIINDIRTLARTKGVPEAIRRQAKKILEKKR